MQPRFLAALVIFIGSYLPLSLVLLVQDIKPAVWQTSFCRPWSHGIGSCSFSVFAHPGVALSMVGLTMFAVLFSALVMRHLRFRYSLEVLESKPVPNDLINYVFPYVVSFMGLSYGEDQKLAGFAVFLAWLFAITYRSGQIVLNPLLLLFGWQLYEAKIRTSGQERTVRILRQGALHHGPVRGELVQDFYFVERDNEGQV
ncbi:hypothetical protein HBF26_13405 [Luteibacter jiangsuensis]|uniref:Uncharacterized protein n=1 Tax=Luteibacter jiangsuensis TaxID=637577 RepID=A0ABX0Q6C9_9GAMM|nr:hypothetical protein [Luteibacter jiangsuensis]NID05891.1 hypothetical protein [Luteibacter jiangsuensis]